jgi:hypothetical protein
MHGNDVYIPIGACFGPRDLVPPRGIRIGVLTQSIDEGEERVLPAVVLEPIPRRDFKFG